MRFSKWHALGNSYLVVERADGGALTPTRAKRLCDVDTGIGSDGVLEVVAVAGTRAEVIIWNPDGSVAEMSGNGTRITAAWLARHTGAAEVVVAVGPRDVRGRILDGTAVETDIGPVEVGEPETVEVGGDSVEFTAVSVGNPHAVVLSDDPTREALVRLGPLLETHPRFPNRTNVQLARADSSHDVHALVWERGAGETSASGSSAVAVAAVVIARGLCESPVTVHMPGGELVVRVDATGVTQVGPAELVCSGETDIGSPAAAATAGARRSIDHVTIRVADFHASRGFYSTVLAPLALALGWQDETLRMAEWGDFSIAQDGKPDSRAVHIAFAASNREEVDAFHEEGIAAGYRDNGAPGERPKYHPGYYGAFLLDPDGNNVEAVFHDRSS